MKLILSLLATVLMSGTCGAAWMWHSITIRPARATRIANIGAMFTPRVQVDVMPLPTPAMSAAIVQAVQAEKIIELSKAVTQLQEQMGRMQQDVRNVSDVQASDRLALNRRVDAIETRGTTALGIITFLGTIATILGAYKALFQFKRRRDELMAD